MITFITTIHVILCLMLVLIILLQSGKGAEMGAVFGGSSQTIFGSRGAATFLSKVTTVCAVGFMVTSLSLVFLTAKESGRSIMDNKNGAAPVASPSATESVTATPTVDVPAAAAPTVAPAANTKPNVAKPEKKTP